MQKKFFIMLAALVVILLLAVWAYLFINSDSGTADDIFADLGLEGQPMPNIIEPVVEQTASSSVNLERDKLRQLTTKPIVGYAEVIYNASSTPVIYYAEKGTGHIYSIDTVTGSENRISATTFAQADQASFTTGGDYFAVTSASNQKTKDLVVGTISTSTKTVSEVFSETVTDFSLTADDFVLYSTVGTQGAVGYKLNLDTKQKSSLFALPFYEARVQWGILSTDPIYLYPKPTYALEGFLYEVTNNNLRRLPTSGFGFTAKANKDLVVYTASNSNGSFGYIYNRNTKETSTMLAPVLPDKCFMPTSGYEFVCGHQTTQLPYTYPDSWYMGSLSYKDTLFELFGDTMEGATLVDTFAVSGREIDIINLTENASGTILYFMNKNDQTLWMYEK